MAHAFGAEALDNSFTGVHEQCPSERGEFAPSSILACHEFTPELTQLSVDPFAPDRPFRHGAGILLILLMFGKSGRVDLLHPPTRHAHHAITIAENQVAR